MTSRCMIRYMTDIGISYITKYAPVLLNVLIGLKYKGIDMYTSGVAQPFTVQV